MGNGMSHVETAAPGQNLNPIHENDHDQQQRSKRLEKNQVLVRSEAERK